MMDRKSVEWNDDILKIPLLFESHTRFDFQRIPPVAELVFGANVSRLDVDVEILYDDIKEMREVFTVHLKLPFGSAEVKVRNAFFFFK